MTGQPTPLDARPGRTRRALLRATGVAAAAGLAGCAAGTTPTPSTTTYGVAVHNRMRPSDFEESAWLHEQAPATVRVIVRDLDPETDGAFLDETVEVPVGETSTVEDAFTARPDGTTYAMTARVEPFTDGDNPRREDLEDSLTFTPAEGNGPSANPIPVVVTTANRGESLKMTPTITIHDSLPEE